MSKDLLDDRFGRFREIPLSLGQRGHEVKGLCLSYKIRKEGKMWDGPVLWESMNAGPAKIPGLLRFVARAFRMSHNADVIWACSDSFYGIIGYFLSKKYRIPLVFDLYDNFEYYLAARLPIIKQLYRLVIRNCDAINCISKPLAGLVRSYGRNSGLYILENAVRKDIFKSLDKEVCRKKLGLPLKARIIGTAGAIYRNRGITTLFDAFQRLKPKYPDLHLALAGPRDVEIPRLPGVIDLGVLPLDQVPLLLNALDVTVVCNRENDFGRYCFPQKTREIMACGIPLIAAGVGSMKEFFFDHPSWLYDPDDATSLAEALEKRLHDQGTGYGDMPDWSELSGQLEGIFLETLSHGKSPAQS